MWIYRLVGGGSCREKANRPSPQSPKGILGLPSPYVDMHRKRRAKLKLFKTKDLALTGRVKKPSPSKIFRYLVPRHIQFPFRSARTAPVEYTGSPLSAVEFLAGWDLRPGQKVRLEFNGDLTCCPRGSRAHYSGKFILTKDQMSYSLAPFWLIPFSG